MFSYPPTPEILYGLAKGRLADRLGRSLRLWALLRRFYGEANWATRLPQPFRYADVRDRLFAPTHQLSESLGVEVLTAACDTACCCQRSLETWLAESTMPFSVADWQQQVVKLTGLSPGLLKESLKQYPFATVHRSVRDDLAYLADLGWLVNKGQGRFFTVASQDWPQMPKAQLAPLANLSVAQTWEMLRSLESISFVQPNLEIIVQSLWEQLAAHPAQKVTPRDIAEPEKRIFIHLDYILSAPMQEQVDNLQEQIEQLWRESSGVIQFDYSLKIEHQIEPQTSRIVSIITYPVCLHYARRAKYLSAYGYDPKGIFGWHNYRLDRMTSPQLKILSWKDSQIPKRLMTMYRDRSLPTSEAVSAALEEAWGFNFYLPRRLLIMRFSPTFAQRYVQQTDRHSTFEPIAYGALLSLIKQEIKDADAQASILETLSQRKANDEYYRAWIRLGDTNIVMRLREWRPNGEVIAPVELRQQMKQESQAELMHYKT